MTIYRDNKLRFILLTLTFECKHKNTPNYKNINRIKYVYKSN